VKDRGWVLFDFIAVKKVPETYLGFSKEFYFMAHGPLPKEVYNEVYNRVLERRARYKECSTELAGF
jgi:hypothetical protein